MKERKLIDVLSALVAKHGTQHAAAQFLGISDAYLCDMLKGRRYGSDETLAKLGLRRVLVSAKVA